MQRTITLVLLLTGLLAACGESRDDSRERAEDGADSPEALLEALRVASEDHDNAATVELYLPEHRPAYAAMMLVIGESHVADVAQKFGGTDAQSAEAAWATLRRRHGIPPSHDVRQETLRLMRAVGDEARVRQLLAEYRGSFGAVDVASFVRDLSAFVRSHPESRPSERKPHAWMGFPLRAWRIESGPDAVEIVGSSGRIARLAEREGRWFLDLATFRNGP